MLKRILLSVLFLFFATSCLKAGSKHALLIGISTYPKYKLSELDWHNIHGANDVALIGSTLKHQGFSVTTLTNKNATAQAIRKALTRLALQTKPGDLVYVHFSGHGQPVEDIDGDEDNGWDEAIVPYNAGQRYIANVYDGENHIIDDELNVYITNIRKKAGTKGFVYVVIDACYSGGMSKGDEEEDSIIIRGTNVGFSKNNKPFVPSISKSRNFHVQKVTAGANTCYIEACRPYQKNTEIRVGKQYYGPLSYYINKVLSSHMLTDNLSWIDSVRQLMVDDHRLVRQNMVIEKSTR